jgi:hypothetical protein
MAASTEMNTILRDAAKRPLLRMTEYMRGGSPIATTDGAWKTLKSPANR